MTITEALAEIKTIDKRIQKKRQFVADFMWRQEQLRDPHEKAGGSSTAISQELQSIADLEERKVMLRRTIQQANEVTNVSVNGTTRSIADWLVWRREVAPGQQQFLNSIRQTLANVRTEAAKQGVKVVGDSYSAAANDVIVNLDELDMAHQIEELEEILGALDGQLSLKNATVNI